MSKSRKPRGSRSLGASAARRSTQASGSTTSLDRSSKGAASEPSAENATATSTAQPGDDVVVVHSRTEDGEGVNVVRKRGDELSLGVVRPLEEGKPILGDVVTLKPRGEHPALFDVKTEVALSRVEPAKEKPRRIVAGPSRATNPSYRKGWDSIWGRSRRLRKPN